MPLLGRFEGEDVLLLELPHGAVPPGTDKLVAWLRKRGVRPMIAHPERNRLLMREPERIEPFVESGCLLQLTAGAVAGDFGKPAAKLARHILEQGWATVLASDAHNLKARPPELDGGRAAAARIVGAEEAERLVTAAPWSIVAGQFESE